MILLRTAISVLLVAYGSCLPVELGDAPLYNTGLYQGDIAGFDRSKDRAAIINTDLLWPEGVVPYVIDKTAANIHEYILAGMEEYHQKTCIRFQEAHAGTRDFVLIGWWNGCHSQVGRVGGLQHLSLGTGCHWKGLVVHELGHALGFYHEQARSDRDDYLEILWDNILDDYLDQFDKMNYYDHNLLNETFDYNSIMLYEENAFSKDGELHTVKVKKEGVVIGAVWKKPGLSESDVRRVNKLYQCFGQVRPDPPKAPVYFCDFEQDDCGYESQDGMGSEFERLSMTLDGRSGMFMVADGRRGNSAYARLITPHFNMRDSPDGCLSFDYYLGGAGAYSLSLLQQAKGTNEVWNAHDVSGAWERFQLPVTKVGVDYRFFFTATYTKAKAEGIIAIDNVRFSLEKCP